MILESLHIGEHRRLLRGDCRGVTVIKAVPFARKVEAHAHLQTPLCRLIENGLSRLLPVIHAPGPESVATTFSQQGHLAKLKASAFDEERLSINTKLVPAASNCQ